MKRLPVFKTVESTSYLLSTIHTDIPPSLSSLVTSHPFSFFVASGSFFHLTSNSLFPANYSNCILASFSFIQEKNSPKLSKSPAFILTFPLPGLLTWSLSTDCLCFCNFLSLCLTTRHCIPNLCETQQSSSCLSAGLAQMRISTKSASGSSCLWPELPGGLLSIALPRTISAKTQRAI